MKEPAESRPSSFEAVFAAYAVVATFALGYGYWRLATRQNEQDAKIEQQRQEQQAAVTRLQREADDKRATDDLEIQVISLASPHLSKLRESGREAASSQRIVAAAAELLSSKGRPALAQMAEMIRAESAPITRSRPRTTVEEPVASMTLPDAWLVLLATLSGDDLKLAEGVANEKLRERRPPSASTRRGFEAATWSCSAKRWADLPLSRLRRRQGGGTCPPMRSPSLMAAGSSSVTRRSRPRPDPRRPTETPMRPRSGCKLRQ